MNSALRIMAPMAALAIALSVGALAFADDPGVPAITPHKVRPAKGQAFALSSFITVGDAAEYVLSHPPRFTQQGEFKIVSANCPVHPASAETMRMLSPILQGHSSLVCTVRISGNFVVAGPPGVAPVRFRQALMIFDVITGNYLGYEGLTDKDEAR
jgi:hypothetical protein